MSANKKKVILGLAIGAGALALSAMGKGSNTSAPIPDAPTGEAGAQRVRAAQNALRQLVSASRQKDRENLVRAFQVAMGLDPTGDLTDAVTLEVAKKVMSSEPDARAVTDGLTMLAARWKSLASPASPPASPPASSPASPPASPPASSPASPPVSTPAQSDESTRALAQLVAANIRSKGKAGYDRSMLRRFQSAAGISADGLYGNASKEALRRFGVSNPPDALFGKKS